MYEISVSTDGGATWSPWVSMESTAAVVPTGALFKIRVVGDESDAMMVEQRMGLLRWPVYAGEAEERIRAESGGAKFVGDQLPEDAFLTLPDGRLARGVGANVPNISAEAAIAALDAIVDSLDEGSTAATIRVCWRARRSYPISANDYT